MMDVRRACLGVVLLLVGPVAAAFAGEVVLENGDVLRGRVAVEGDAILLDHEVLGALRIEKRRVRSFVRDGTAAATPALDATSRRGCETPTPAKVVRRSVPCPPPSAPAATGGASGRRPWDFSLTLGISDEGGNTDKFAYNVDIQGAYRWGRNTLEGRFRSSYEEVRGDQTEGKFHGLLKYARRVSNRGEVWGLWISDRDDFADLLIRTGFFVGYRHSIVDVEKTKLRAGAGPGVLYEERVDTAALETAAVFAFADFRHEFRHGDSFRASYWAIPYFEETGRSPMRLELAYAHPLRNHFDVTASFLLDYVPEPPEEGIKSYDTKFLVGLRWKP